MLAPPNPLRHRPGVTSAGPASYPPPRHEDLKPSLPPDEQDDPFAVQTAFKNVTRAGVEAERETSDTTTLSVLGEKPSRSTTVATFAEATPNPKPEVVDLPAPDVDSATAETAEIEEPAKFEPRRLSFSDGGDAKAPTAPSLPDPLQMLASWNPESETLVTAGSALALVVGLLLMSAWLLRKAQPRGNRPLPKEVAEVLGRAPLGGRTHAQLLRLGNKLVLVSVSQDHAETICEITDEVEVARLRSLCEQQGADSAAAFDELFGQMSTEPTDDGFLGSGYDARRLAAAYANTPGGRSHA